MNTIPLFSALSSQGQRRTLVLCLSLSLCVLCSGCQLTTSSAEQVQAQNITTQRHNEFLAEVYADMANHLGTYFPLGYTQFEVMLPEASNTPEHPDDQPNGQLVVQPLQPEQALARALAHKGAAVCQSLRTCNFKAQPLTTAITSGGDYTLVEVFAPELTLQRIYNERAWPLGPISIYGTRPSLRASAPSVTTNTARPAPAKIVAKATAPVTRRSTSAKARSVQPKPSAATAKIVAKANAKAPTPTPTTTSSVAIGSNQAASTVVVPSPAPQKPVAAKVAATNPVAVNTTPQSKSQAPALSIPAAASSSTTNKAQPQSEQMLPSEPALPSKAQSPAPKAPTTPKVEIKGPLQFAHEDPAPAPATAQVSTPQVATPEATPVTASQVTPVTPQKTTSAETKTLVSQTKPQQQPKESGSTPANNPALTALISHNLTERYSFAPSLKEPLFISPTQADRYTQRSNLALQNLPWQWGQRLIAWAFGSQTKL